MGMTTLNQPVWQWDEMRQVGTDYASEAEVETYDRRMSEVRDVAAENRAILDGLPLGPESVLLEIGTGTGALARAAAARCRRVVAVDVSAMMLQYARRRAEREGLANLEFVHAGFLTYASPPATVDAVVTGLALHHLPDLWKAVALERIRGWLKPGGILCLNDVVFDWGQEGCRAYFDRLVGAMAASSREPFIRHIRQEYSTLAWIMEGLLVRAGFKILSAQTKEFLVRYCCRAV
jgi:ubiquinone/menaquinone biosynthesis C-methylase UbiE